MTTKQTRQQQQKLEEYGESSPPLPKRPGRPRRPPVDVDPNLPKQPYKTHKKILDSADNHATYVLNQERQKKKALSGRKPRKVLVQDQRVAKYLIGDMLLDRLANGELLKVILGEPGMPTFAQVQRWRRDNLYDFEERFQWAMRSQAEAMGDDIIIIGDSERDPRDKRVMFDTRRFVMAHRRPEIWGERMTLAGDKNNPLFQGANVRVELAALSDSELAALEAFTLARKEALAQPVAALDVPFTEVTEETESDS